MVTQHLGSSARVGRQQAIRAMLCICLGVTALAGACGDDKTTDGEARDGGAADSGTSAERDAAAEASYAFGDRRIPYTPENERAFIAFFVAHHEMAVDMAKHEVMHGENAEVKAMAERMITMQSAEIETMRTVAEMLDTPEPPAMMVDPHAEADMEHMETMHAAELDAMFLTDMIEHHAAGLPVAHRSHAMLRNSELRALAQDMMRAQANEIGELQSLREELNVKGAGEDAAPAQEGRADVGLQGDRRIPMTPAGDVEFVDFFVPHHAMATHMAEAVVARGSNADVRSMAQAMLKTQEREINEMRSQRERLAGKAESPALPADEHMDSEMAEMMDMNGADLDRMFLSEMIPHHAAALPTAHRAKPHVKSPELQAMADDIFEMQAREVGEMQRQLDQLSD